MRKLIRSRTTGLFLTKESTWTNDVRQAEDYRGQAWPLAIARRLQLEKAEFYYLFGNEVNSRFNFAVRLG